MKRPLRVLFYGMTHEHAGGKLDTLENMRDDYEVVAIVDDRPRGTRAFADHPLIPGDRRVVSEREAFDIRDIDVGFVETTNADLMDVAAKFVERGIPMHCDKPCGESMEPYRTLLGRCRAANLPFQIGYMYRGNPAIRFAWEAVAGGMLGDVGFIEADMNHDYGAVGYPEYIGGFRGGILYNLGCHLVDLTLPMVKGEFLRAISLPGDAPGDPVGAKTRCAAVLRFKGTDVMIRTSSNMPGGILCRRLRVDGSNGTLEICPIERFDGERLKLTMRLKKPWRDRPAGESEIDFGVQHDRYRGQLEELAAIVRGERPNDQNYDRDLKVHELTLAACGLL